MSQTYVTKTKTLRTIQCSGFKVVTIMNMTKVLNPAALTKTMKQNSDATPGPKEDLLLSLPPWCRF